jgi:predicted alpha/beta superfamily hydrolase
MKKIILKGLFFCVISVNSQEIKVTSGTIQRFLDFKSEFVAARNIDVWLPDGYSNNEQYAVLYLHDGQMLFDAETTWNKQAWEVDECAGKLVAEKKIKKFIVVAIWNNPNKRHPEYFPQKPYESLSKEQKSFVTFRLKEKGRITDDFKPISDDYLKFLVTELKPFIDRSFATKKSRKNTFIGGSSMGALVSIYAICEYPKVFGGAACMSTHWPGIFSLDNNPIPDAFLSYLNKNLPNPKNHSIYFDCGDQTLDALYPALQKKVDAIMNLKGYTNKNWNTKFFKGEEHSEQSWRKRLHVPLVFLLKK